MGHPTDGKVRVRFPTLELFALRSGGALATRTRRLTPTETDAASVIFQQSLDLSPVRVIVSRFTGPPFTVGSNIRSRTSQLPLRTMIHELTHVWQYQTKGMGYVSDSVWHQGKAALSSSSRDGAYSYKITPRKSLHQYTAEQQASIVEHYFASSKARKNPSYQTLIDELRRTRPIPTNVRRRVVLDEIVYGPGRRNSRLFQDRRMFKVRGTPGVPLIRLEF